MTSISGVKLNWRKFGFFEKTTVTENIKSIIENDPVVLKAEGGSLFIGDSEGHLYQMDRALNITSKQKLFTGQICGLSYIFNISV